MTTVIKGKIVRDDLTLYNGSEETAVRRDSTGGTIVSRPLNDFVDVLHVYGRGVSFTRSIIQDAVNKIGVRNRTVRFNPGTWEIDDDLTIPSNITSYIPAGAVFNVASGKTLTFNGPIIRESETWTSGSGTVTYSVGGATVIDYADPVSGPTYLKTVSDIINGERVSSFRWISTAAERAAIIAGTTVTDHTTVLNQMFQDMKTSKKGHLYLHPGLYNAGKLIVCSNLKLDARGATVKTISSLSVSDPLLINEVFNGTEENIEILGGTFQGPSTDRNTELVSMLRITNLKIIGTRVTSSRYIGIAIGGCVRFEINNVEIDNFGKNAVTTEGGAGLWIGVTNDVQSSRGKIISPTIRNGEWAGIYVAGKLVGNIPVDDVDIIAPKIFSVKEAGIFGGVFNNLQIIAPKIYGVTRKNISSSGIECGGTHLEIIGGAIQDVEASGIALTNTQVANISGIKTVNARRDAVRYPTGSHISIITTEVSGSQPKWIGITGHTAVDLSSPSYGAIEIGNTGAAVQHVSIQSNNYAGTAWASGKAINIASGKWGVGCVHRNNAGANDSGSVSDDRGDADVTLNVGFDEEVQRFATTLTANRTVTLGTTAVYDGATFRVVRTGLGAFTLDVGGLVTLPSATAAWAEVRHTGSGWIATGYGTFP